MTDLSPQAQTVLDAYFTHADLLNREVSHEEMLAAAIRAVADQAHPKTNIEDIGYTHQNYIDGWKDALDVILAIATELEGQ
jgi:hypothetical protein